MTATGDGAASAEALLDALVIGFVSPSVGANGAGSARLTVENLGTVIYDHTFSDSLALL